MAVVSIQRTSLFEALRDAKANAATWELQATTTVLAADARTLPFQPECFDAIVHTDVFC
ncbi:MAG: class I SAM-dependent methyltransferase [bacterium]